MAIEDRIEALKRKHADVDEKLREESLSFGTDPLALTKLKSIKLRLKDEIERLGKEGRAVA